MLQSGMTVSAKPSIIRPTSQLPRQFRALREPRRPSGLRNQPSGWVNDKPLAAIGDITSTDQLVNRFGNRKLTRI